MDAGAGKKVAAVQFLQIQQPATGRIGRKQHLKAPIEGKVFINIGPDTSPDRIGCLEHKHLSAGILQSDSARKTGNTGPDNDDVHIDHTRS